MRVSFKENRTKVKLRKASVSQKWIEVKLEVGTEEDVACSEVECSEVECIEVECIEVE